jgi:chaperonin GroES
VILFQPKTKLSINHDLIVAPNLCDRFDKEDLDTIGSLVWQGYARDKQSRMIWERRNRAAMDLAMQVQEQKTFPWPGSSNVVFPLITIAALQFSGRSYTNLIQGTDIIRYRVTGQDPHGDIKMRAERIGDHMSWQVTEEDQAWEEQHDRLFINVSIVGTTFMKTFLDGAVGHNVSEMVMARDLVIDYWAKSLESARRKTHVISLFRNDLYEGMMSDIYVDYRNAGWFNTQPQVETQQEQDKRSGLQPPPPDQDTPFTGLEQHCFFDFDHDGYAEPYTVTIERGSRKTLRIVARFDEADVQSNKAKEIVTIRPTEFFTKYSFIPSPDGSIYDMGFGLFLGPLNEVVNSGINQLLDRGTMNTCSGGFLGRGAKIRGGAYTFAPWQWARVDSSGDDLRKNMVPLPERNPDEVMFKLIGLLIEYANRIAGTTDEQVGKNPGQNTPASTYQGMQEQGMQVYGMIYKRIWRCMKEEFRKLYMLNRQNVGVREHFGASSRWVSREDYLMNPDQIAPVADPNITSTTMRMMQAEAILERAGAVPGFSVPDAVKNWLRALRVDSSEAERLYPGPDKVPPLPNPKAMIENMKLQGKKMELDFRRQELLLNLRENRGKLQAEILKLTAEAQKTVGEAKSQQVTLRLEALKMAIDAMKAHAEMSSKQIELLEKQGEAAKDSDGASDGGGVDGVAPSGANAGANGAAGPMGGGPGGAVAPPGTAVQ